MSYLRTLREHVRALYAYNFAEMLWFWHKLALLFIPVMMVAMLIEGGNQHQPFVALSIINAASLAAMLALDFALIFYFTTVYKSGIRIGTPEGTAVRHYAVPRALGIMLGAALVGLVPHHLFFAVRQGTWWVLESFFNQRTDENWLDGTKTYYSNNQLHAWVINVVFPLLILLWDCLIHALVSRPFKWRTATA